MSLPALAFRDESAPMMSSSPTPSLASAAPQKQFPALLRQSKSPPHPHPLASLRRRQQPYQLPRRSQKGWRVVRATHAEWNNLLFKSFLPWFLSAYGTANNAMCLGAERSMNRGENTLVNFASFSGPWMMREAFNVLLPLNGVALHAQSLWHL